MFLVTLQKKPDFSAHVTDDQQAASIFREIGWLEKVEHHRRSTLAGTMIFSMSSHPTHWIIGAHYAGCIRKEDDGFIVWCLPKFTVSEASATQELRELAKTEGVENWRTVKFSNYESRN